MKSIVVMVAVVACRENASNALDASPTRASVDETVVITDAAPAPTATLLDFDGGVPTRAPNDAGGGGFLLCQNHSVWTPPAGFVVTKVGDGDPALRGIAARKGDELVAVAYPPHADDSYATVLAHFASGAIAWDARATNKNDAQSSVHGRAANLVFAVRTLRAGKTDVIWLAAAKTDKEADALLDDAKKNTLALPNHACACGDDCLTR